jgi:acetyl/propionyl-CoA carboxylase alpha subunit
MKLFVDGRETEFEACDVRIDSLTDRLVVKTKAGASTAVAVRQGDAVLVSYRGRQYRIERKLARAAGAGGTASGEMRAPMPGLIVDVFLSPGAVVAKGDKILVLEAMKTQQSFSAPYDGVVSAVVVAKGDQVIEGALLAVVSPAEGAS